ncbi:hypothetical protein AVEN_120903-1 [Araneus ventricosus]|uniref:DDE-1 domain-containing protein n=1 Tax=Araneus ventricosus TaxID=182803 RepID=A0A4Y2JHD0_ARAVE|nr:hypothetical protein AVEN_120903-1 [Araneus ventricosus]
MEYRHYSLRHVIARMDGFESDSELSKKISIGDALDWIKTSWEKIGQEVITKCFVSCGINSREMERQLDLFNESTAIDQLGELSKLAGIEKDPESFQHEAAVVCFDDYSADWEEGILVNVSAEDANSVSEKEFSDTVCNRQQANLSTQATLGKINEVIRNSDAMTNESVRDLLLKLKNELEKWLFPRRVKT